MSLESVSQGTRINPAFIKALEEDAFQLLPSETYVRGFLQSYAKFIRLDPAEILGLYRNQVKPPKDQVRQEEGGPSPLKVRKKRLSDFLATIFGWSTDLFPPPLRSGGNAALSGVCLVYPSATLRGEQGT